MTIKEKYSITDADYTRLTELMKIITLEKIGQSDEEVSKEYMSILKSYDISFRDARKLRKEIVELLGLKTEDRKGAWKGAAILVGFIVVGWVVVKGWSVILTDGGKLDPCYCMDQFMNYRNGFEYENLNECEYDWGFVDGTGINSAGKACAGLK